MALLAQSHVGRILLHLLAMAGDHSVRFHAAGIVREMPWLDAAVSVVTGIRARLVGAFAIARRTDQSVRQFPSR